MKTKTKTNKQTNKQTKQNNKQQQHEAYAEPSEDPLCAALSGAAEALHRACKMFHLCVYSR